MPQEQPTIDLAIGLLAIGLLLIGLISIGLGRLVAVYDWLAARRAPRRRSVRRFEGAQEPRLTPRPEAAHMSSQENAPRPPIVAVPGSGTAPVPTLVPSQNDLTYDDAVRTAAAIKVNGKWWLSGKKLYSQVGGNHDHFLRLVAEVRGDLPTHDIPTPPAVHSPIAGRPIPAGVSFHDDPELEYRALD